MSRIPKVKFKINLDELFGGRHNTNEGTRQSIGQAIIDKIVERTAEQNVDKFGKTLGKYSPGYKKSLGFKVMKGGQGTVNLKASGDMLASITIVESTPHTITIGFDDAEQNAKAYGHISGMAGHPVLDGRVKVRDFFGLPKRELESIASDFEDQVRAVDAIEKAETRDQLDRAITDLISDLEGEIEVGES